MMRKYKKYGLAIIVCLVGMRAYAQQLNVEVIPQKSSVIINIGGKAFTSYIFPDSLPKPVLYPIYAADDQLITRGFPIKPRPGEPRDHPHQLGCWLTYENINGIDFWNNSYAIPAAKKSHYGWIKTRKIIKTSSGKSGELVIAADWQKQDGKILLKEKTRFRFSGTATSRTIDRTTTLTAQADTIHFYDAKDGLFGLRVTKELQLPEADAEKGPGQPNGNYITSSRKIGNAAWGSRAGWCMLYGVKQSDTLALCIFSHPKNPGYPPFWHARGYGLFAANPIAHQGFNPQLEKHELTVLPGQSVTFRYRLYIVSGHVPDTAALNHQAEKFATE